MKFSLKYIHPNYVFYWFKRVLWVCPNLSSAPCIYAQILTFCISHRFSRLLEEHIFNIISRILTSIKYPCCIFARNCCGFLDFCHFLHILIPMHSYAWPLAMLFYRKTFSVRIRTSCFLKCIWSKTRHFHAICLTAILIFLPISLHICPSAFFKLQKFLCSYLSLIVFIENVEHVLFTLLIY